jgi:hypothetical protein
MTGSLCSALEKRIFRKNPRIFRIARDKTGDKNSEGLSWLGMLFAVGDHRAHLEQSNKRMGKVFVAWKGYPMMRHSRDFREKVLLLVLGVLAQLITTKLSAPRPAEPGLNTTLLPSEQQDQIGWQRDLLPENSPGHAPIHARP